MFKIFGFLSDNFLELRFLLIGLSPDGVQLEVFGFQAPTVVTNLFVHGQSSLLILFLLLLVLGRLMQGLQPDVAESDVRVCVVTSLRLLQDPLKLFLTRTPFHFGQMKVADQGPAIGMFVAYLEKKRGFEKCNSEKGTNLDTIFYRYRCRRRLL